MLLFLFILCAISFKTKMKRMPAVTVPCATELSTSISLDSVPLTRTFCFRFVTKLKIHLPKLPLILAFFSFLAISL